MINPNILNPKGSMINLILEQKLKHDKKPYDFFRDYCDLDETEEQFNYDIGLLLRKAQAQTLLDEKKSELIKKKYYLEISTRYKDCDACAFLTDKFNLEIQEPQEEIKVLEEMLK